MAQSWLLLSIICFNVLHFVCVHGHGHEGYDMIQIERLWQEVNSLQKTQSHHSACLRGIRHDRKCFIVSEQIKTHSEANEDCVAQGGTLAIPQNSEENNVLRDYAKCSAPECQDFWIGISAGINEGSFVDVNGKHVTFFNWAHNGGDDEDCVSLAAKGKWHNEGCDGKKRYFCQFLISQCASRLP